MEGGGGGGLEMEKKRKRFDKKQHSGLFCKNHFKKSNIDTIANI